MHFEPQSKYKVLNEDFFKIWTEFRQNLGNLRQQNCEFNSMFMVRKDHRRLIKDKSEELYSNLYLTISFTQILMKNSIKN